MQIDYDQSLSIPEAMLMCVYTVTLEKYKRFGYLYVCLHEHFLDNSLHEMMNFYLFCMHVSSRSVS